MDEARVAPPLREKPAEEARSVPEPLGHRASRAQLPVAEGMPARLAAFKPWTSTVTTSTRRKIRKQRQTKTWMLPGLLLQSMQKRLDRQRHPTPF